MKTIEEIKQAKIKLESDIKSLIDQFYVENGILEITVNLHNRFYQNDEYRKINMGVQVEVEIKI